MDIRLTRNVVGNFQEPGWDYSIRKSPYARFHLENDARYCVYNGRLMPLTQGIDRFEGYWALRKNAALFDVGERPIEIAGPDAERLCDYLFTRDCTKMKTGRAGYGVLCYEDGGVLCDGILMRLADDRFWYVQADGPVYSWLAAHKSGMDVTIRDPGSWVAQVQGPASLDVLAAACDDGMPEPFGYFDVARATMGGQPVLLSRTGWTAELGFEFYTLPEERELDGEALWRHVRAAGEPHGLQVAGLDAMDIRRIEAGILNNVSDMDQTMTPYDAGIGGIVKFDKGDFIGKQALRQADQRPLLRGIQCDAAEPLFNASVLVDDKPVAKVTAAAWSPYLQCGIGIVCLSDRECAETRVQVVGRDLQTHDARIVDLPMYDADKDIPRGRVVQQWDVA